MTVLEGTEISCGVRQLAGLCKDSAVYRAGDRIPPKEVIVRAFTDNYPPIPKKESDINFGVILFSDSVRRGNGKSFATYITRHKLGKVISSSEVYNPNTKRPIQVWMWEVDRKALVAWFKKNAPKDEYADEFADDWY